ncbi:heterogeneous nuclear ribonucleoprotein Q-like protein [Tanacetum coccineum]
MSDDEEDQVEIDANLYDTSSLGGHDSMRFGPLVPTESERSLMERVRQELKHELEQTIRVAARDHQIWPGFGFVPEQVNKIWNCVVAPMKRHLRNVFRHFDRHALELLEKMMTLDPDELVAGGGGPGHHYGNPRGGPLRGSNRYLGGNPSGGGYNPYPSRGSGPYPPPQAYGQGTGEDLRKVFSEIGDIIEVRLLMNPMTNKNKGFAFIRFATVEQARRALTDFKRPTIKGKQCGVALSQDSDTLFVGIICKTWSKDMLKEKLMRYGIHKFVELPLVEDAKSVGMNQGFAFLDFPTRPDTLEACRRLQKRDVIFGTDRTTRIAFADTLIEHDDEVMAQVRTVFVDGLTPWTQDIINDNLRQFGKIEKVELARNMPAAKRDDFGFITFSTHESAVSCVHGINDSELVFRNKEVKVRARLSRPRRRGKSAEYARGGYTFGGDSHGSYSSWEGGSNRMDSHRFTDRGRRSIRDHSPYDGGCRRSFDSRDERGYDVLIFDRLGSKRPYNTSIDISFKRRSPECIRQNVGRPSSERQINRNSYTSRGAGYMEDSSRTVSRVSGRGTSHMYNEDDQKRRKKLKCY